MKVITFSLYTQQPLLATSFQGDPNSDISYSYIPGSMIRGAVIGRYLKQHGLQELDLDNDEVKRLFFDANSTKYLNAYLLSHEDKRTLPVVRSWFKEKDAELNDESPEITIFDFGIEQSDELENPKSIGEGFCIKKSDSITLYKEKRRINIHNQRDRKQGRSTQIKRNLQTNQLQGEGEIFRYEAIDSKQTFQAVIICSNETDANSLIELLQKSEDIWLGGSRTAGYGHIKISNVKLSNNWNEVHVSPNNRIERDFFTVTLLSDLILRDEWGQYAIIPPSVHNKNPAPLTKEIEKILGVKLHPIRSYANSTLVGGFNRKWGLPLPQVAAFAAGSVFVFEELDITPDAIRDIEARGIGERRNEGFGRIAINWLDESSYKVHLPSKNSKDKPELQKDFSRTLAAQMAERLLHQKIERALQNFIGRKKIEGDISNSQLSRLEIIARKAISIGDCSLVLSLLDNLPSHARGQLERAKIYPGNENCSLKQQLDEWLKNAESWTWVSNKQDLRVNVANIERSITDEFAKQSKLAEKYTLRLIMALAKKARKESK
ncbi:MAG: RAMP superfamily CRISPR-associated protein [Scytonema sp. PMC 1069.18]|nr:RAMP superfamily CRISPR-associated protein [Scytonema sp. PMC 1069.18]MEC4880461.1 RAMP superfamily CRISPR-associated protein [Scytonema sp. PMC 1070.18]